MGHSGGRPMPAGGGRSGSRTAHSASVRSLAKRSPSRICCARVVAVHIGMSIQLGLDNPLESHPAVATQPPFRNRSETASQSTIYRWVQRYTPEIEKRLRWQWHGPGSTSWHVDETYV